MVADDRTLVTVVIPAHNAERFIKRAIASVLSQTHERIQLIVVDDGSSDDTVRAAAAWDDPRLTLLPLSHGGVSRARNHGLTLARGRVIAFLDADDSWLPEKLTMQLAELDAHPEMLVAGCFMRYESMQGRMLGITGQSVGARERRLIAQGSLMPYPLSSALFRTKALREAGGFDEDLPGLGEDLDLLARLAARGRIGFVPQVLGAYRVHKTSASVRHRTAQRMATRFVRERIAARASGVELAWEDFETSYSLGWRQRYGDRVQALYRSAGESAAEGRWLSAVALGLVALVMGPRYTTRRLLRQQLALARRWFC